MGWVHGTAMLAGVGAVAISGVLLWLFGDSSERPARSSAKRLIILPMTILLVFVTGIALLFMSAALI